MTHLSLMRRQGALLVASRYPLALIMLASLVVGGCTKTVEKTEDVRPVRVIKLVSSNTDISAEYAGEVRPRIESRLGFRVNGKIVERKVEVGTIVKRGQVLMQLDPQDLALAQVQAKAGLSAAESNLELAKSDLKRYQDLRDKNFVAVAVLEGKETAYKAAKASYEQALAGYRNQTNQSAYTTLVADVDGVVTAINAEVGQVVAAGSPVVQIAKAGDIEVVVGIPEDKVNTVKDMTAIGVRLWANPGQTLAAKLRELSPIADPATRTYTAKLTLLEPPKEVKLGMTAYVTLAAKNPQSAFKLPLSALLQDKDRTSVWLVENGAVKLVPVQLVGSNEQEVLVGTGLSVGQTVVTAGVNLLKAGQKVSILADKNSVNQIAQAGAAK